MPRSILLPLAWMVLTGLDARANEAGPTSRGAPAGLDARAWATTDAVLDHHVDPPTRQQMILDGLRAVYRSAGVPMPGGLARRLSALAGPEQLAALLDETWSQLPDKDAPPAREGGREGILIDGMLGNVPGGARRIAAKDLKVEEQFAGNHYVGLQIALSFDAEAKRPTVKEVSAGGPAQRAGVLEGDVIEQIDGVETEGMDRGEVLDRLRGVVGSDVVIRVRQPKSDEARRIKVTRGLLPRQTVQGIRKRPDGSGDVLIRGPESIGYLKFREIAGSTPHELRVWARRLEDEGAKALVLDLRALQNAGFHPTVLLADCLLETGTIGRVRSRERVETFEAEPDALFRGWPLAVLVDRETSGVAHWLAAALQDNHRAVVVGVPTDDPRSRPPGMSSAVGASIRTAVPIGDGAWLVEMPTGLLERRDGLPIAPPVTPDGPRMRRAARPGPATGDAEGRPKPDIAPEVDPNVNGDAILTAALRNLRATLKSSQAGATAPPPAPGQDRPADPPPDDPARRDEVRP